MIESQTSYCSELKSLLHFLDLNNSDQNEFFATVHNTLLQFVLSQIIDIMQNDTSYLNMVKKIYSSENDNIYAAQKIANKLCNITIDNEDAKWLDKCLHAHFAKKPRRKTISNSIKLELLEKQNYTCACCGKKITISDCYDHIIPWELVGDELEDNGQMLCQACNLEKNAKVYFEFQHKLISTCDSYKKSNK